MALSQRKRRLVARLGSARTRAREGLVLVEGVRAVSDALAAGAEVRFGCASPRLAGLPGGPAVEERLRAVAPVERVDHDEMAELADTDAPQGILAVCAEPRPALEALRAATGLLVLDGVQDPGNLGTLIRAAVAFGAGGVVTLPGTVDPWLPKCVRAAAGMAFRLPVARAAVADVLVAFRADARALLVGDAGGEDVANRPPPSRWALALGNEGRGCGPEVVAAADRVVSVPTPGPAESLNVALAGAVLLYALTSGRPARPA